MYYCGSYELERIVVHPDDDPQFSHFIDIVQDKDMPKFTVTCCCNDDWSWDFWYNKTNYEVVKFLIMDCVAECETMDELLYALDDVFEEDCEEIVFDEDDSECDGDCDNCCNCDDTYEY